jgi:uncharacterized caspase-like protein
MTRYSRRAFAAGAAGATVLAGLQAASAQAAAGERIALVVGIGAYQDGWALASPERDATTVSDALKKSGFDTVELVDLPHAEFIQAVEQFAARHRRLSVSGVGFFYYSGMAGTVTASGKSFLIPVDARLRSEADYPSKGIAIEELLRILGGRPLPRCERGNVGLCAVPAPAPSMIVAIDACGLAASPKADMLVATSTMPGKFAFDNGNYASALAKAILTPGQTVEQAFSQVTVEVLEKSAGHQSPRYDSGLVSRVVLTPGAQPSTFSVPAIRTKLPDNELTFRPSPDKRFALIIANEKYGSGLGALPGTQGDAEIIREALIMTGFPKKQVVDLRNLKRPEMIEALNEFYAQLDTAGDEAFGFFYYSGHGMAQDPRGQNYLLPIDAVVSRITDLPNAGISLNDQFDALETAHPRACAIVVDACRSVPVSLTRGPRGFAPVSARSSMLIGFATSPGQVAQDDGLYGKTLAKELVMPEQDIDHAFLRTNRIVAQASGQMPETRTMLIERVVLS